MALANEITNKRTIVCRKFIVPILTKHWTIQIKHIVIYLYTLDSEQTNFCQQFSSHRVGDRKKFNKLPK